MLVVLCDGKVVCGCADPYGERPLGDLAEHSIHEIWNSGITQRIRHDLNQGYSPFCLNCGLKRFINSRESIPQRPLIMETIPRIFFEPTVLCNLSCFKSVCSKESGIVKTRSRPFFPTDTFKNLMAQIGPGLIRLDFFNYGEPFVHPDAVEMLEYVRSSFPGIYVYVSTNGLTLDESRIRRIVQSGIDEITFSVDGPNQPIYEKYRCGGDFQRAIRNMAFCVHERNRTNREVPFINWRYILFRWNDPERLLRQTEKLAASLGVDRLTWEITDHPAEAASHRYQIGTKPWKKRFFEIWDTSQLSNAIKTKRYMARIRIKSRIIEGKTAETNMIDVKVTNIGGATWLHTSYSGRRIVRLGAQLYARDRTLIHQDYARAFLPESLAYKKTASIRLELPPIDQSGEYLLKFDMVSEGIDWFEHAGSAVVWKPFRIASARRES